ncbi:hypothetical protein D3C71_1038830 [compost metagenome]
MKRPVASCASASTYSLSLPSNACGSHSVPRPTHSGCERSCCCSTWAAVARVSVPVACCTTRLSARAWLVEKAAARSAPTRRDSALASLCMVWREESISAWLASR